ncbi:MAG: hypothetical protein HY906_12945 [Deltaproteobacteria bacterium]|nr:hypothetical protein [Deltaproteobacteria bacterium]
MLGNRDGWMPLIAVLVGATVTACGPAGNAGPGGDGGAGRDASVDRGAQDSVWLDPDVDNDGDGYTIHQGDCDDTNPNVHPGAREICTDGIDNDCNGFIDGQEPDKDGDGFGPCQGDCDDTNPNVHPGAKEIPGNGIDDNCDGLTDDDLDGDGYLGCGNPGAPPPPECDCDDNDPDVHPGALEICGDGKDNDCNGYTDAQEPDQDGDGYGPCSGDCDDNNPSVHPGAPEIPGNGIDDNCDNLVDEDLDGDGWTVENGDCDDHDPTVNPGMPENCTNGKDDNCNGVTDTDCLTPCDLAALERSSVGCEYFAVDMDQYPYAAERASCFAVIVSNTHATLSANVQVYRYSGSQQVLTFPGLGTSRAIAPGQLAVFRISGSCSSPGAAIAGNAGVLDTGLGQRNAFRIVSDLPVVAYQINPYEAATIHTTDASLLIPTSALDKSYYVMSWPQYVHRGMMNVVGVTDGTTVTVTSSTSTAAGTGVPALAAGGTFTTTLNRYDNLQIGTAADGNDLSGTKVVASNPVAVFGGHQCSTILPGMGYCDHLEEQMMPTSTWATEYVAARYPPRGPVKGYAAENTLWRLVGAVNGTTVAFDPASVHAPVTLNAGQVVQFESGVDFMVRSTDPQKPFFAVQYMLGAEYTAQQAGTDIYGLDNLRGDPAMAISVPTAQFLERYVFLSDPTYSYNWLVVVRSDPTDVIRLDCFNPIPNARFATVGAGPYQVARIRLSAETGGVDGTCTSGAHTIWGDGPFGIWVWGVYADTSYGYPGGMNLTQIYPLL